MSRLHAWLLSRALICATRISICPRRGIYAKTLTRSSLRTAISIYVEFLVFTIYTPRLTGIKELYNGTFRNTIMLRDMFPLAVYIENDINKFMLPHKLSRKITVLYEISNVNARSLSFASFKEIIAGLNVTLRYLVTYFRHILIRKWKDQSLFYISLKPGGHQYIAFADLIAILDFCDTRRDWSFIKVRYQFIA